MPDNTSRSTLPLSGLVLSARQLQNLAGIVQGEDEGYETSIGFVNGPMGPGLYAWPTGTGKGKAVPLFKATSEGPCAAAVNETPK